MALKKRYFVIILCVLGNLATSIWAAVNFYQDLNPKINPLKGFDPDGIGHLKHLVDPNQIVINGHVNKGIFHKNQNISEKLDDKISLDNQTTHLDPKKKDQDIKVIRNPVKPLEDTKTEEENHPVELPKLDEQGIVVSEPTDHTTITEDPLLPKPEDKEEPPPTDQDVLKTDVTKSPLDVQGHYEDTLEEFFPPEVSEDHPEILKKKVEEEVVKKVDPVKDVREAKVITKSISEEPKLIPLVPIIIDDSEAKAKEAEVARLKQISIDAEKAKLNKLLKAELATAESLRKQDDDSEDAADVLYKKAEKEFNAKIEKIKSDEKLILEKLALEEKERLQKIADKKEAARLKQIADDEEKARLKAIEDKKKVVEIPPEKPVPDVLKTEEPDPLDDQGHYEDTLEEFFPPEVSEDHPEILKKKVEEEVVKKVDPVKDVREAKVITKSISEEPKLIPLVPIIIDDSEAKAKEAEVARLKQISIDAEKAKLNKLLKAELATAESLRKQDDDSEDAADVLYKKAEKEFNAKIEKIKSDEKLILEKLALEEKERLQKIADKKEAARLKQIADDAEAARLKAIELEEEAKDKLEEEAELARVKLAKEEEEAKFSEEADLKLKIFDQLKNEILTAKILKKQDDDEEETADFLYKNSKIGFDGKIEKIKQVEAARLKIIQLLKAELATSESLRKQDDDSEDAADVLYKKAEKEFNAKIEKIKSDEKLILEKLALEEKERLQKIADKKEAARLKQIADDEEKARVKLAQETEAKAKIAETARLQKIADDEKLRLEKLALEEKKKPEVLPEKPVPDVLKTEEPDPLDDQGHYEDTLEEFFPPEDD